MVLLNVIFCALYPSKWAPVVAFVMLYAVAGGWWLSSFRLATCRFHRCLEPGSLDEKGMEHSRAGRTHLTCSLISSVVPASSSHLPRKSSPRKGFNGFFSLPSFSLRLAYCCFNVLRNHFSTNIIRFDASFSFAGATSTRGISAQYAENSVRDVVDRIKAGAVMVEKSPLKDANCYHTLQFSIPS